MIQPLLDKIDIYTRTNNKNTDISNNKLLLDPKYKFIQFFTSFFISSAVILLIVLFNSNIIFLINSVRNGEEIIDLLFPNNCISSPYGPQYLIDADGTHEVDKTNISIIRPICERINKTSTKNKSAGAKWPYTQFDSKDKINPIQDYYNFILRTVATTDTTVNTLIKKTLELSSKVTNRFIITILGLIILALVGTLIVPFIIYGFNNIINEFSLIFSDKTFLFTKFLIFSTFLIILFLFNPIFSLYKVFPLFYKLTLYPILNGNGMAILKIMIENKDIIGFILGYFYILSAKKILSNTMYTILQYLYFIALIIYIILYITRYV